VKRNIVEAPDIRIDDILIDMNENHSKKAAYSERKYFEIVKYR